MGDIMPVVIAALFVVLSALCVCALIFVFGIMHLTNPPLCIRFVVGTEEDDEPTKIRRDDRG